MDRPYVAPDASGYRAGARVWADVDGAWRPAVVLYGTARAVTVRFRDRLGGTSVDTVTGTHLRAGRVERDHLVDGPPGAAP